MSPPDGWRSLLGALLPERLRTLVLDDLDAEFRRRVEAGPAAARRWYRREVLRGIGPALAMRLRRKPRRDAAAGPMRSRSMSGDPRGRWPRFDALGLDLRIAARNLRTRPGYLAITVITLAIGIGGGTIVFSVIDAVAFGELPYRDADRLVLVWERSLEDAEIDRIPVSAANYLDWQSMAGSFEGLAAYDTASPIYTGDGSAQRFSGLRVTGNLFEVLGVDAASGRVINEADVEDGGDVVVISDGLWERAFGRDPEVVGRNIILDGTATTVIGIMPPDFRFPYMYAFDVWRPLGLTPEHANDRSTGRFWVLGRLREGITRAEAQGEGDAIAAALAERYPESVGQRGISIIGQRDEWLEGLSSLLGAFALAGGLGLGIACLNLTALLLSRGLTRSREISTRRALGASTARIARLLLAESAIIAGTGAALGIALAAIVVPRFGNGLSADMGRLLYQDASVDLEALAFGAVLAFATAVVAGLVPSLQVRRAALAGALGGAARSTAGRRHLRLRRALVVAQTTLALVLLGQAAMLGRSMYNAYNYDLGFNHRGVLSARVRANPDIEDPSAFYQRVRAEAAALPGVSAAALANIAPLTGGGMPVAVTVDGSSPSAVMDADGYNREVQLRLVGPEFFDLLEIPTLAGRTFGARDTVGSERVAVVNRKFATMFFGTGKPIGESLRMALYFARTPEGFDSPRRIVGLVGDVAEWGVWMQPPIIYLPLPQQPPTGPITILLRAEVPPDTLVKPLENAVWRLGSRMPIERVGTLAAHMSTTLYSTLDFIVGVMGSFAAGALLLAAIGLYGVIAFQVRDRTREISIRMALGARGGDILGAVLGEGFTLAALGALLGGVIIALAGPQLTGWFIGMFVFDVPRFDPVSVGGAAAFLVLTAIVACVVPARRAARVDPAQELHGD